MISLEHPDNKELLKRCRPLRDYTIFVSRVRKYQTTLSPADAVDRAVDECIKEGILSDFLSKHKSEVKNMIITEFDEEAFKREMHREAEARFAALIQKLLTSNRTDDLLRATSDEAYREELYKEFQL